MLEEEGNGWKGHVSLHNTTVLAAAVAGFLRGHKRFQMGLRLLGQMFHHAGGPYGAGVVREGGQPAEGGRERREALRGASCLSDVGTSEGGEEAVRGPCGGGGGDIWGGGPEGGGEGIAHTLSMLLLLPLVVVVGGLNDGGDCQGVESLER